MDAMAAQITGISIVCSTVCSGAHQIKHQSSVFLASVRGIHRSLVDSPHKGPVTRKMTSSWKKTLLRPHGDQEHRQKVSIPNYCIMSDLFWKLSENPFKRASITMLPNEQTDDERQTNQQHWEHSLRRYDEWIPNRITQHYSDVHDGHDGVSNHQPHLCLLNRLFRRSPCQTRRTVGSVIDHVIASWKLLRPSPSQVYQMMPCR